MIFGAALKLILASDSYWVTCFEDRAKNKKHAVTKKCYFARAS